MATNKTLAQTQLQPPHITPGGQISEQAWWEFIQNLSGFLETKAYPVVSFGSKFENWSSTSSPLTFRQSDGGATHVQGVIKALSTTAANDVICTFPKSVPTMDKSAVAVCSSSDGFIRVSIQDRELVIKDVVSSGSFVELLFIFYSQ